MTSDVMTRLAELKQDALARIDEITEEIGRLRGERTALQAICGQRGYEGRRRGSVGETIRRIAPTKDEWNGRDLAEAVSAECESDVPTIKAQIHRLTKTGDLVRVRYGVYAARNRNGR